MRRLTLVILAFLAFAGCSKREPLPEVFRVTGIGSTYIPLVENPSAKRVLLVGGAEILRGYFERAGLVCENGGRGAFDIVCVRGNPSEGEWKKHVKRLAKGGVLAWSMDVKGVSAADFKARLVAFPCAETHLWIPGLEEWLLVGRVESALIPVDAVLEVFTRETAFEDLVHSGCETLPELLASYVGTREQVLPAFETGDLTAVIKPEHVLRQDIPAVPWLTRGEVDLDIYAEIEAKWRQYQLVRGEVVMGGLLSEKGDVEGAIRKWSEAWTCNPHDPLLMERLDRLAVNAQAFYNVGNVKLATSCLETAVLINPKDAANVRCLAQCYMMSGKRKQGEELLKKADKLVLEHAREVTNGASH